MDIQAGVSITRDNNGRITIRLTDKASRIGFVEVLLTPEQFALAVTGLSGQEVPCVVRGLENVGKTLTRETRGILCPVKSYDKKVLEQWLKDNAQEEGWVLSTYLGGQGSVTHKEDGCWLNYEVYKYV